MLEKFPKYASFFSIMFFIGAVWFDYLYYESFGIQIFTYVSFSEIINLFIGFIPMLVLVSLVAMLYIFMLSLFFQKYINKLKNYKNYNTNERRKLNSRSQIILSVIFFIWFILVLGPTLRGPVSLIHSEAYIYMKALGSFIVVFWAIISFPMSVTDLMETRRYSIIFVIVFYVSVYYLVSYKLWNVRHKPSDNLQAVIHLKNSPTIFTNDTLIYIGKTKDYIFLYSSPSLLENSHSIVINMDQVERMEIPKYINWLKIP